jgi:hypothetical protein
MRGTLQCTAHTGVKKEGKSARVTQSGTATSIGGRAPANAMHVAQILLTKPRANLSACSPSPRRLLALGGGAPARRLLLTRQMVGHTDHHRTGPVEQRRLET